MRNNRRAQELLDNIRASSPLIAHQPHDNNSHVIHLHHLSVSAHAAPQAGHSWAQQVQRGVCHNLSLSSREGLGREPAFRSGARAAWISLSHPPLPLHLLDSLTCDCDPVALPLSPVGSSPPLRIPKRGGEDSGPLEAEGPDAHLAARLRPCGCKPLLLATAGQRPRPREGKSCCKVLA
jgi:hypothetical protein